MLHIDAEITQRLDQTIQRHVDQYPEHTNATQQLREWFAERYGGVVLRTPDDFIEFQEQLADPVLPQATGPAREILENVRLGLHELCFAYGTIGTAVDNLPEDDIVTPETADRLDELTGPEHLQALREFAQEYYGMMSAVSPEALATILMRTGELLEDDYQRLTGLLADLLRPTEEQGQGPPGPGAFLNYNPEFIEQDSIREYAERILTRVVYKVLMEIGADHIDARPGVFMNMRQHATHALHGLADTAGISPERRAEHGPMFERIVRFYEDVVHLDLVEVPDLECFVHELSDYNGVMHPFLSLRQLIATRMLVPREDFDLDEMRQQLYVCFRMGEGKTPVPFVVWKLRNARRALKNLPPERLIGIMPPQILWDIANQIQDLQEPFAARHFFLPGTAPTTGVIHSEHTTHQRTQAFDTALQAEFIACSNKMLQPQSVHRGRTILQHLQEMTPRIVFGDEAQITASSGGAATRDMRSIFLGSNVRILLSGTPAAKRGLSGAATALEILEDPNGAVVSVDDAIEAGEKYTPIITQVRAFRTRLHRLLILDEPRDYAAMRTQEQLPVWTYEALPVDPASPYADVLQSVTHEDGGFWRKYHLYCALSRAPWLRDPEAESPFLPRTQQLIQDHIGSHRVIWVNEDSHTEGIFKEHPAFPQGETAAQRLQHFVAGLQVNGEPVEFRTFFGDVSPRQRRVIRQQVLAAQSGQRPRLVVFANGPTVRTGMDLNVRLVIRWGVSFRRDDEEQEFNRFHRTGREARMIVLYGVETVDDVKRVISNANHQDETMALHGDNLPPERQAALMQSVEMQHEEQLGPVLATSERRQRLLTSQLHQRGATANARYWGSNEPQWRALYLAGVDRSGTDPANMQRCLASLISSLEQRGRVGQGQGRMVEIGPTGLALSRHLHRIAPNPDRELSHVEPLQYMLDHGTEALQAQGMADFPRRIPGNALDVPALLSSEELPAADCVILHHLTRYRANPPGQPATGVEWVRALHYARRLAHTIILPFFELDCTQEQFEQLRDQTLPCFGLTPLALYSGQVVSGNGIDVVPWRGRLIVAERAEGPAPSEREVLTRLAQQEPQAFSHFNDWSAQARNARDQEIGSRLLPFPAMATIFSLPQLTFEYTAPLPHLDIQMQYRQQQLDAVRAIRMLAPTAAEWNALTTEQRQHLNQDIRFAWGQDNPGFFLTQLREFTFYPYDAKWDVHVQ